ncbi:MAG: divalent-cation tolerance protein CutA [Methylacidiphilales bacterium]|nr:divalent-cation tolerance protein CutA [Candidatus Methylacidiphilales bacterium]
MKQTTGIILVFCSVPDLETGRALADLLLKAKAAACVSILPGVESHYVWQGKREQAEERLLIIKATGSNYPRIEELLISNHPYECPEIVEVPAGRVAPKYRAWLQIDEG